ncbi:hypothetical protein BKA56DRAFT_598015 [Ilyonectria sp. MPI-CAGE-AT-0026]|nr:hypothetical protein BKA56DRAFT_598015 [Ilyonectria sp. MPI-CAGE-AT-0026]
MGPHLGSWHLPRGSLLLLVSKTHSRPGHKISHRSIPPIDSAGDKLPGQNTDGLELGFSARDFGILPDSSPQSPPSPQSTARRGCGSCTRESGTIYSRGVLEYEESHRVPLCRERRRVHWCSYILAARFFYENHWKALAKQTLLGRQSKRLDNNPAAW